MSYGHGIIFFSNFGNFSEALVEAMAETSKRKYVIFVRINITHCKKT